MKLILGISFFLLILKQIITIVTYVNIKKTFRVIIKILKYISAYPLQCIFNLNLDPSRTGYGRAIFLLDLALAHLNEGRMKYSTGEKENVFCRKLKPTLSK
jgi:hypothetical protein